MNEEMKYDYTIFQCFLWSKEKETSLSLELYTNNLVILKKYISVLIRNYLVLNNVKKKSLTKLKIIYAH